MLFLLKMPLQTEAFVQLEQDPQVADEPQLADLFVERHAADEVVDESTLVR